MAPELEFALLGWLPVEGSVTLTLVEGLFVGVCAGARCVHRYAPTAITASRMMTAIAHPAPESVSITLSRSTLVGLFITVAI